MVDGDGMGFVDGEVDDPGVSVIEPDDGMDVGHGKVSRWDG
jgi:hypothetical protein